AWAEPDAIGLVFDRPISVMSILAHHTLDELGHRIRQPRLAVDIAASLHIDDQSHAIRIRDVSQAGMRVALDQVIGVGRQCALTVPSLGRRGVIVRWCRDAHAGLTLRQPLSYADFAAWRQALAAATSGDGAALH
ncbi:MAG: PilZ domain-containing protein, partial [Sphingomonas sp.]